VADLITPADLEKYGVEVDLTSPRVGLMIQIASDEVIDAAGSPILQTRSVVELAAMPGRILRLPGLPVTDIHAVSIDGLAVTGWTRITAGLYRPYGWSSYGMETVTVDYTHGLPTVPADIKDLVARMVFAGLLAAADGTDGLVLNNGRMSSFAVDDYREAYATGEEIEAVTEMTLPDRTRQRLAKRFGAGASVAGAL
jgi:hypothetical protein